MTMLKIDLKVEGATIEQNQKYKEILCVLLEKGALDGMRAGSTTIHFSNEGEFSGIEMAYWPWRKRQAASGPR